MLTLLLATRNAHKIEEIKAILGHAFAYLSLKDFPKAPEVTEDAASFAGNAAKKAIALAKWITEPNSSQQATRHLGELNVLADDSGLEVDALHGAPGVHSARFAALDTGLQGNSSDALNREKLLRLLRNVPANQRTARFRCFLALTPAWVPEKQNASPVCYADEFELATQLFEGACEGHICFEPRGQGGFGYDPLFVPEGYEQTFAELGEKVKNPISHRGRALGKLRQRLSGGLTQLS
jgi:XTP/dITP diphosphohydrolase